MKSRPGLMFAAIGFVLIQCFAVGCGDQQATGEPSPQLNETSATPEVSVQGSAEIPSADKSSSGEAPEEEVSERVELEPLPSPEGSGGTFSIAQVMQLAHDNRLYRHLFKSPTQPEIAERLALLYESLPQQTPPKGDQESWESRTRALSTAAQQVIDGDPGGPEAFKRAVNCNSCHSRHRS